MKDVVEYNKEGAPLGPKAKSNEMDVLQRQVQRVE
jgi:hypothetical protein